MLLPILIFILADLGSDWLTDTVGKVLIGQAIIGAIGLIGLVSILKRFLSTEFPAAMKQVNERLDILHKDFEDFQREFRSSQIKMALLEERVDRIREKQRDMDDSGFWQRPRGGGKVE